MIVFLLVGVLMCYRCRARHIRSRDGFHRLADDDYYEDDYMKSFTYDKKDFKAVKQYHDDPSNGVNSYTAQKLLNSTEYHDDSSEEEFSIPLRSRGDEL